MASYRLITYNESTGHSDLYQKVNNYWFCLASIEDNLVRTSGTMIVQGDLWMFLEMKMTLSEYIAKTNKSWAPPVELRTPGREEVAMILFGV